MTAAPLRRYSDWPARLHRYIASAQRVPFQAGVQDCGIFVADAIQVMTGADLIAEWRGKYRTLKGIQKRLLKAGFNDHVDLFAARLPEHDSPAFARAGDVAVFAPEATGELPMLGLYQGQFIYAVGDHGLALVARHGERAVIRAFRVG